MITIRLTGGRLRAILGLGLAAGLALQCGRAYEARQSGSPAAARTAAVRPQPGQAIAAMVPSASSGAIDLEALAAADPIGFFEMALDRYDRSIRDYTCTFSKQELVGNRLTEEQVISAMFCEKPFSVRFEWVKNEDKCSRVLYVADRWVKDDQQLAVVEPGAIARLFVPYVMRPIHGRDAQKSSRRTIDQFGFRNSLALILKYCKLAREQGVLESFAYVGNDRVEGRDTLVFERRLPYTGEQGFWPDRLLIAHIDRETLLPILCVAYADDARQVLLGRYMMTDVKLNPNLPDSVFTMQGMGLSEN